MDGRAVAGADGQDRAHQGRHRRRVQGGAPKRVAAGDRILRDCVKHDYITCLPVEKSGQAEFQFEYGDRYASVIEDYQPTFVKTLVRYNPEDDERMNRRQAVRLRDLTKYLHGHDRYFMFELQVPATVEQMDRVEGDHAHYDRGLWPSLMMGAIKELQNAGWVNVFTQAEKLASVDPGSLRRSCS